MQPIKVTKTTKVAMQPSLQPIKVTKTTKVAKQAADTN
jgi:hypothetical protein